jgi:hypothetical protein
MNRLAQEMAKRNGYINFKQACAKFDTTKVKLRHLISTGLLSCHKSELDRRAKLLSLEELERLFGNTGRKETPNES